MNVVYVKQKHRFGCEVACLSMVTGIDYDEILKELGGDFDTNNGMTFHDADEFLCRHGYATSRLWMFSRGNVKKNPWPPQPWTDVHLCQVQMASGHTHAVVLLRSGRVLDPQFGDNKALDHVLYKEVNQVAGVHKFK